MIGAVLLASPACRKAAPDEIVTTKQRPPASTSGPTPASGGAPSQGGSKGGAAGADTAQGGSAGTGGFTLDARCGDTPRVTAEAFTKSVLLESIARCAMFRYCKFAVAAERLRDATRLHRTEGTATSAASAKQAFTDALVAWQRSEVFRFGPAAPQPSGLDLRDRIYSWPREGRCKVDEQLVSRFYQTDAYYGTPSESFVTGRSLAAVEYLLFYTGTDNGCTQYSAINANGSWASLSATELAGRKAEYAAAAAEDVLRSARLLVEAWDPDQGNFYGRFVAPGNAGSAYPDEQSALNAVNYGLFYLDKEVKDYKLAIPMGLSPDCPAAICPDRVESRYASPSVPGIANTHLLANLAGFRDLFIGCGEPEDGVGFDDWLRAVGAGELASRMTEAIAAAESAVTALQLPLEQAIPTQPERTMALYDAIKAITDPLKSEFLSVLNLQVPKDSETDND